MPAFAGADLEFAGVLSLLAARTRTPMGRRQALELQPSGQEQEVAVRLALLTEMVAVAEEGFWLSFSPLPDPEPELEQLLVEGVVLEGPGLLGLSQLAATAVQLRRELSSRQQVASGLFELISEVPDLLPLVQATDNLFLPDGELQDNASPELAAIRRRLGVEGERLRRKLESFLQQPEAGQFLQDTYVTQRNERFVIPVRADSPTAVNGIVHGSSASGATLFVEPMETVVLNNQLVQLREAEKAEVRRILAHISQLARVHLEALSLAAKIVGRLDLVTAAARLGADYQARPAELAADRRLALVEARHLLLQERLGREGVQPVPITLHMEEEDRVLVISGPNTGGKTVALKTVGLAALMNQAGLPVPCREAVLPVFRQVLTDIGDHQSIAENLSTFSSHIRALVDMTGEVESPALVLVDELGTGTDPEEGAALGIAIVEFFRQREALVLVTTHHNGLKAYAETTGGVRNASVEFDEESLRPTYRLLEGVAGRSGGLDMARRLGLRDEIVSTARQLISDTGRTTERYIARLAELTAAAEDERQAARQEHERALAERQDAVREQRKAKEQLHAELERTRQAVHSQLEKEMRQEIRRLEKLAGREQLQREAARASAEFSRRARQTVQGVLPETAKSAAVAPGPLQVGDRVRLTAFGIDGDVESMGQDDRLTVVVKGKRMIVKRSEVSRLAAPAAPVKGTVQLVGDQAGPGPGELNLIGWRVEEALVALDRQLDSALLHGQVEVRVVHGHGTGRLRKALRRHLDRHPAVESQRPGGRGEGGEGATVVRLRN